MNDFTPTLTDELRRRLLNSADRLVKLLHLGAPDVILANEVGILYRKALAGLGPALWEAVFRPDYLNARRAQGLCLRCEAAAVPEHLCPICAAAQKKLEDELAAEPEYDWGVEGPPAEDDP